jgi:molybdopterin converting factor small subunit
MTIIVKLFGDLRKRFQEDVSGGVPLLFEIKEGRVKVVSDILKELKIDENAISHIFVNSRYSGLRKKVKDKDLVALFPKNMGLLYKWYFDREEDE